VAEFAVSKGFMPVIGSYHWDIERYGRADPLLQYERKEALHVFENILASETIPAGYFENYIKDNIQWLQGKSLSACDAGKYSIAIDASGNVSPCLALEHSGNLLEKSLNDILNNMDKEQIKSCSDQSRCNMMCSRIVGSAMTRPISTLRTPNNVSITRS
ncbi:MAG: SPASM domain-containing protein, partial [Pseudomonadota bacterium]